MNNLKIRCWDKTENIMHYNVGIIGDTVYLPEMFSQDADDFLNPSDIKNIDDTTLMLYSGLKDASGNDIYDNDIIEYHEEQVDPRTGALRTNKYIAEIEFSEGGFFAWINLSKNPITLKELLGSKQNVKVVGNKIENNKLLDFNYHQDKNNTSTSMIPPGTYVSTNPINQHIHTQSIHQHTSEMTTLEELDKLLSEIANI